MYRKLDVDAGRGAAESDVMLAQWPAGERPRERLYWSGPDALADAELLALQLGSGTRGRSAIDVAREVLATYGSLNDLATREADELALLPGIGPAKAARLAAAFELTRRLRARAPAARLTLAGPAEVYAAFGPLMEDLQREVFRIALLDTKNGLLRDKVISEGTLSASLVHPRAVFKPVILESAASVILLHNHPSGDPTPSREDVRLTRQLVDCARLLDLRIHDHVIVGRGRYVSLAEQGLI
jgi:DNA repair protein RadC